MISGPNARTVMSLGRIESPHTLLADLDKKVATVKKTKRGGRIVYACTLTEEGAKSFAGPGGRRAPGAAEMATSGTCRIEVGNDKLSSIAFEIKRTGGSGERTFEMTTVKTFAFKNLGKAEYKVPAEALALFKD